MANYSKYVSVELETREKGVLGSRFKERIRDFERQEQRARVRAAHVAQQVSSKSFNYRRPANAKQRPGRSSTGGKLRRHISWSAKPDGVELDVAKLDSQAPHWIINEIGTGKRATIRRGGVQNPRGRARKGASYVRTVKAQKGRRISVGLAFGTGPSGRYTPPRPGGRGQQLYVRSSLKGNPTGRPRGMIIRREITGQHFIRDGARAGATEYKRGVLKAARSAFVSQAQKYRP